MALPDQYQLQVINQIADALTSRECRMLFYLFEYLDLDDSMTCMKEMLKHKVMNHENGRLLLAQLMLHLRRFDIIRKVLKTTRQDVERDVKYRQDLSTFRVLMVNINEDMTSEDLKSLKFLLSNTLSRERIETTKNFLDVTIELEKQDLVSPERVDFVEECLKNINRIDLARQVANYKMLVAPEQHSSQQQSRRAPCPPLTSNGSHSVQLTTPVEYHCNVNKPAPVYEKQNCKVGIPLDWYKFNTNPRGVCVIIDCVGNDGDMLEKTFKALHFKVVLHKWLSVGEALSTLRGIFRQGERHNGDGFVCCIISRGTKRNLLCTNPSGTGLQLESIRRLFTADACPMLAGKPKLFFIQRYSVPEFEHCHSMHHRDEDLETDGRDGIVTYGNIPIDADVFWSHCWTDQRQLEQGHHHSVYLNALTDALHKGQQRKTKLIDVHTEVNQVVFEHNMRNPGEGYHIDLKHTLRKDLCLP